jgi:hypothetical protein
LHISVLALYGIDGFLSIDCHEGGYNAEEFMAAVQGMIIPFLNPFPQPSSVLVLDNCGIHHTYEQELIDMVEATGAKLLFLAPYSPLTIRSKLLSMCSNNLGNVIKNF